MCWSSTPLLWLNHRLTYLCEVEELDACIDSIERAKGALYTLSTIYDACIRPFSQIQSHIDTHTNLVVTLGLAPVYRMFYSPSLVFGPNQPSATITVTQILRC